VDDGRKRIKKCVLSNENASVWSGPQRRIAMLISIIIIIITIPIIVIIVVIVVIIIIVIILTL